MDGPVSLESDNTVIVDGFRDLLSATQKIELRSFMSLSYTTLSQGDMLNCFLIAKIYVNANGQV